MDFFLVKQKFKYISHSFSIMLEWEVHFVNCMRFYQCLGWILFCLIDVWCLYFFRKSVKLFNTSYKLICCKVPHNAMNCDALLRQQTGYTNKIDFMTVQDPDSLIHSPPRLSKEQYTSFYSCSVILEVTFWIIQHSSSASVTRSVWVLLNKLLTLKHFLKNFQSFLLTLAAFWLIVNGKWTVFI